MNLQAHQTSWLDFSSILAKIERQIGYFLLLKNNVLEPSSNWLSLSIESVIELSYQINILSFKFAFIGDKTCRRDTWNIVHLWARLSKTVSLGLICRVEMAAEYFSDHLGSRSECSLQALKLFLQSIIPPTVDLLPYCPNHIRNLRMLEKTLCGLKSICLRIIQPNRLISSIMGGITP